MSREQITRGRRDFMTTLGRGGLAASLMGGGVLGAWGAMNTALGQPLPGPLRIHGNPVATRDKDMKPFKQQYDVDLQIQLSVTHTETVTRIYSGATKQFDLFTLQHPFIKKLARDRMILPIDESKIANIDNLCKEGLRMSYAFPKEKPIMWFTNYIVSKDTQVQPTVWAFLNYCLSDPFTMSMTNDFDYRMGSSRQLTLLPPERIKQIGLDNIPELVRNSYTYLLPDRLDKYVEAWAEVKAAS